MGFPTMLDNQSGAAFWDVALPGSGIIPPLDLSTADPLSFAVSQAQARGTTLFSAFTQTPDLLAGVPDRTPVQDAALATGAVPGAAPGSTASVQAPASLSWWVVAVIAILGVALIVLGASALVPKVT